MAANYLALEGYETIHIVFDVFKIPYTKKMF